MPISISASISFSEEVKSDLDLWSLFGFKIPLVQVRLRPVAGLSRQLEPNQILLQKHNGPLCPCEGHAEPPHQIGPAF